MLHIILVKTIGILEIRLALRELSQIIHTEIYRVPSWLHQYFWILAKSAPTKLVTLTRLGTKWKLPRTWYFRVSSKGSPHSYTVLEKLLMYIIAMPVHTPKFHLILFPFSLVFCNMARLESYHGSFIWNYLPSFVAGIVFASLFAICSVINCWRVTREYRKLCCWFILGGFCELIYPPNPQALLIDYSKHQLKQLALLSVPWPIIAAEKSGRTSSRLS